MPFENLIGNEPVKKHLLSALQKKTLPTTLVFHGPNGVGKSLFARELAKKFMDVNENGSSRIDRNNHPDFHVYFPEGKGKIHSIGCIRSIIDEVFKPPFEAKEKVFVIHDAEKMQPEAAHALLKTLEEPTLDTTLILLTSHLAEILPTILSRALKLRFTDLSETEIVDFLEKEKKKSLSQARYAAKLAQGSLAKALAILDSDCEKKKKILFDLLCTTNYLDFLTKAQEVQNLMEESFDEELIFSQILMWFRDLHLLKDQIDPKYLYFPEIQSYEIKNPPAMGAVIDTLDKARLASKRHIKLSHCLEFLFLKLQMI